MEQDYYTVLGLAQTAEPAEIRATYRALMRRYHPDADGSEEAARQARTINQAYAVLGDAEKREAYDRSLAANRPLKFDPAANRHPSKKKRSLLGPVAAVGFTVLAAGMVLFALVPKSERDPVPGFSFRDGAKDAPSAPASVIKAQRPPPADVEEPTLLPQVADRKIEALPAPQPKNIATKPLPVQARVPAEAEDTRDTSDARCSLAPRRSERLICEDTNLASLDRQLTLLYSQSWSEADDRKRSALLSTRQRFNDRREACASTNCLTTTYVGRLREISDIMAGRSRP